MSFCKSVTGPTHEGARKRMHGCFSLQCYSFSEETFYLIFHVKSPKQVERTGIQSCEMSSSIQFMNEVIFAF